MKKTSKFFALIFTTSILLFSCGGGGSDTTEAVAEKAVMPENYSLAATWSSEYKSNKFTLKFNQDMTGSFVFDDQEEIYNFKYEEERPSENRINLTIVAMDKSQFNKESLQMYNMGWGFSLKLEYSAKDEFRIYNGVFLKDGMLTKDDGRVILKHSIK